VLVILLGRLRVGALLSYVLVLMGMCLVDLVVADLALAKCWRVGCGWLCVCRVLAAAAAVVGGILGCRMRSRRWVGGMVGSV
jgi:hypothetical protein